MEESEIWFDVPYQDAEIKLISKNNNSEYNFKANETGKILLEKIVPGIYDVNVSLTISADKYTALTGTYVEDDFVFNYSLSNKGFYQDEEVNIKLITAEIGGFVIKQIYYTDKL